MKVCKRSISFAVFQPEHHERLLIVQRPHDDEDLPDAWGLPAASLREGESWEDAVRRAGQEKLGIVLEVGREIQRGDLHRAEYTLEMRLFEARIMSGSPRVRQDAAGVTHYRDWRWDTAAALEPAARAGSLCCKLFLETLHWNG